MPQDAFTLKFITNELKDLLLGGKISKINQPEKDELSFIIYTKKGTVKLEISAQAQTNRISLSQDEKPNPVNAPNFCMLLRKHLQNAEITNVAQSGFDRVVIFTFHAISDFSESDLQLYCEIMGKYSNIILVENGIILGALKTTSLEDNTKRILFTGAKYTPPAPQEKANPTSLPSLQAVWHDVEGDTAKFICNKIEGIAYSTALDMVETYGENISAEQIFEYVNGEASPCVTLLNGKPNDFHVRSMDPSQQKYPSLLEAQTAYYSYVYQKKTFESKKRKLESAVNAAVKKSQKRLAQIEQKLFECEEADKLKLMGELITANIWQIQKGMDKVKVTNYYDENGSETTILLDKQLTPAQNAQKYYKKYAKQKRTITALTEQKIDVENKLDYLKTITTAIETADRLDDFTEVEEELILLELIKPQDDGKKKKKQALPPYREYFFDDFKIIAGRNNIQNERLTKNLNADDIWLHTQKYHSTHVGIITNGRKVPDNVLEIAAEICAYYSDGKEGKKIPVDYTLKKYVKKPPKSNTGFVIYTDYKTVLVDPDPHYEAQV